jgi:hypothetical protein
MEVNMNELEDVTGGVNNEGGRNCYFEPQGPLIMTGEGSHRRVKCKSRCSAKCGCHGTHHCINQMHLIESNPGEFFGFPFPKNRNNHSDTRKRVELPPDGY